MDERTSDGDIGDEPGDGADRNPETPIVDATIREGVLQVRRPGTQWLSSGSDGGFRVADAAYNVSVPTGFSRTDLSTYVEERRREAAFPEPGPALLTGLSLSHARGARHDPVCAVATAGLSNPAALPLAPDSEPDLAFDSDTSTELEPESSSHARSVSGNDRSDNATETDDSPPLGTVNLLVTTDRALDDAGLATLLATAVEAKTATLLGRTGFPGTTSDAIVVGCDPDGEYEEFTGSATPVGAATRACVRAAVTGSLRSRYPDDGFPSTVAEAEYGVRTTRSTEPFRPSGP